MFITHIDGVGMYFCGSIELKRHKIANDTEISDDELKQISFLGIYR